MKKVTMSEDFGDIFSFNKNDYLKSDGKYHNIPIKFGVATMSEEEFRKSKINSNHFIRAVFFKLNEF